MDRLKRASLLGLIVALQVSWHPAQATTVLRLSAAELVDRAELIFTGTAVDSQVILSRDGLFPFTFITFQVEQSLKGQTERSELTLRLHGGATKQGAVLVSGMPAFRLGESYLLFVKHNGKAACPVVGWGQGQLRFTAVPQSGRTILVDEQGAPLAGLSKGRWVRGKPMPGLERPAELVDAPGAWGVAFSEPPDPSEGAAAGKPVRASSVHAADASEMIELLRALIQSRSTLPSFHPGRLVRSAALQDLPDVRQDSIPTRDR